MSAFGGKADIGQIGRSLAPSTCIDEVLTRLPHQRIFASDRLLDDFHAQNTERR